MKRSFCFLVSGFISLCGLAQAPSWLWAKTASGAADLNGLGCDNSGNVYAAGAFGPNSLNFGTTTLSIGFGSSDMFLAKYSGAGNVLWAKQSSSGNARAVAVAADAANNAFVTGVFVSNLYIDTCSLGSFPNNGTDNVFVAKFDPSGNIMWARRAGGDYYADSYAIATDGSNAYVTGSFMGSYITFDGITLNNPDQVNKTACMFLAKYNGSGTVQWARCSGGNGQNTQSCWPSGITTDDAGDVYLAGQYTSVTASFGTFTLTNHLANSDVFLVKYNAAGTVQWASSGGGMGDDFMAGVACDNNGSIVIAGKFYSNTCSFDSFNLPNLTVSQVSNENLFLVKYNSSTGLAQWARNKGRSTATAVTCDIAGQAYITGSYRDSVSFGNDVLNQSPQYGDFYVAEYDANGNDLWGKHAVISMTTTGNNYIMPHSLASKPTGGLYAGGSFDSQQITLDTFTLTNDYPTNFQRAIFVARTNLLIEGIDEQAQNTVPRLSAFPNPFGSALTITFNQSLQGRVQVKFINVLGSVARAESVLAAPFLTVNTEPLATGIYMVEVWQRQTLLGRTKMVKE